MRRVKVARRGALVLCLLAAPGAVTTAVAAAALPNVVVHVGINPALPGTTAHTGSTVSASCPAGTTLVGGGGYLRNAANPATIPTNGLVLGGSAPGTGSSPDTPVANGTTNPTDWMSIANFTGVAETGDEGETFAMCTTGGPSGTIVETASTTGANATQQVSPPIITTATCPAGDQLIGGGSYESTPGQINDGTTVANSGNLKPMASYPSNSAGVMAADGSTNATSWSAWGSSGIPASTDTITALAVCSTTVTTPPVQVARQDLAGPNAQAGTTVTTATVGCPAGTQMISGGFAVDETVGSTSGLETQQGYHMRGTYPSDASGNEVTDGMGNPAFWTSVGQNGGQSLPSGDHYVTHTLALCQETSPTACVVTAIRRAPNSPSGHDEEDVTVSDPGGVASISNVSITNGTVWLGGTSGTEIDNQPSTTLPGDPTSVVVTAEKTVQGVLTRWSFYATDATGTTTLCS